MNAWAVVGSALGATLVAVSIGDAASGRFRGWLDRLPHRLIQLAGRRLDDDFRSDVTAEWTAELDAILRQNRTSRLPLFRLVIGIRFAAGLLRTAKVTNGYLAGKPQHLASGLVADLRDFAGMFTGPSHLMFLVSQWLAPTTGAFVFVLAQNLGLSLAMFALWLFIAHSAVDMTWRLATRRWRQAASSAVHGTTPAPSAGPDTDAGLHRRDLHDTTGPERSNPRMPPRRPGTPGSVGNRTQPSPTGPAIQHPATRAAYRQLQRGPRRLLGATTAALIGSAALAACLYQRCMALHTSWVVLMKALFICTIYCTWFIITNLLVIGFVWWARVHRLGVELAGASWRPCRYHHIAIPGDTEESTRHVLTLEPELAGPWEPLRRQVTTFGAASNQAWQPTGSAWVAGDPRAPRRLTVGLPGDSVMALYRVTRPRGDLKDSL